MLEYSIFFTRNKFELAKSLSLKIKEKVKELSGVETLIVGNFDINILIAVPDCNGEVFKEYITDILVKIYTTNYKLDYLLKNFNFEVTSDLNMKAFIKTLLVFDIETDKKIVKQKLYNVNTIVLDSFFNFRLVILKKRWEDLINLANDNVMYLMSKDTFVELIKFLVSNIEFRSDYVFVKQNGDQFNLYDENGLNINDEFDESDVSNEVFLITSLIGLNPKRIRIDTTYSLKDNALSLLYELFNNRVEILK